jgi:hypothetical protein
MYDSYTDDKYANEEDINPQDEEIREIIEEIEQKEREEQENE